MPKLSVKGISELEKKLKANVTLEDVKTVIRHNGAQLQSKMMQKADFTEGYQTGTTKRSIRLDIEDGGMTAAVEPTTEYSPYLEYGTRYMHAQPFVRPALLEQETKFKADMQKLVR